MDELATAAKVLTLASELKATFKHPGAGLSKKSSFGN